MRLRSACARGVVTSVRVSLSERLANRSDKANVVKPGVRVA
ncbi:hypothetical protein [Leptospira interrogans]|nr:hypothetical protein [Leptospira interrogans]